MFGSCSNGARPLQASLVTAATRRHAAIDVVWVYHTERAGTASTKCTRSQESTRFDSIRFESETQNEINKERENSVLVCFCVRKESIRVLIRYSGFENYKEAGKIHTLVSITIFYLLTYLIWSTSL